MGRCWWLWWVMCNNHWYIIAYIILTYTTFSSFSCRIPKWWRYIGIVHHAFGQAINANEIDFPPPKEIPCSNVILPFIFVTDEAFLLDIYMMRPYARTYRTFGDAERIFNYRLSRARRVIKNAFGIMLSRWRIMRRNLCYTSETVEDIIKAIVCFYNFLIVSEDDLAPSERTYCSVSMLDRKE